MQNETRPLKLKVDGAGIAENLRIRVKGRSNMTLFPDCFLVDINNLSAKELEAVRRAKYLSAVGEDQSTICYGEITDIYLHQEDLAKVTSITVADGKAFWETKVSKSVGAGASVRSAINSICEGIPVGSFLADDVRMLRGQTFVGRLPDCISTLAKTLNARAYITRGMLHFTQAGKADDPVTIQEKDLTGNPSKASGILILKTKVKGFPVGIMVRYNGRMYRLISQTIDADNQSGLWQAELMLLDESELDYDGMGGG